MDQPTAGEALKRLEPLVGAWTLEGTAPGAPCHVSDSMEGRGGRGERSDGPTNRRGGAQATRAAGRRMDPRGQAAGRAALAGPREGGEHRGGSGGPAGGERA